MKIILSSFVKLKLCIIIFGACNFKKSDKKQPTNPVYPVDALKALPQDVSLDNTVQKELQNKDKISLSTPSSRPESNIMPSNIESDLPLKFHFSRYKKHKSSLQSRLGSWYIRFDHLNPISIKIKKDKNNKHEINMNYYFNFFIMNFEYSGLKGFVQTSSKIFFDTKDNGIYYVTNDNHRVKIGYGHLVIDPVSNISNLEICTHNYQSVCTLDIIEHKDLKLHANFPSLVMRLSIYTPWLHLQEQTDFLLHSVK